MSINTNVRRVSWWSIASVALLVACSGNSDGETSVVSDSGPELDATSDVFDAASDVVDANIDASEGETPTYSDTGLVYLDECRAFNGACEGSADPHCGQCQYRIITDSSKCSAARPCDNLLLFFAAMGCDSGPFDQTVKGNSDFVVACVQPLAPGEILPSSLGAPQRDDVVVSKVLEKVRANGWNGKNLLMGGCSAGATRYPVVAARYPDDDKWVGSGKTAACMSDGVVSVGYQDKFMGEKLSSAGSCVGRHRRVASAYTTATPGAGHSCSASPSGQCGCDPTHAHRTYPGDCAATGGDCVDFDSIIREDSGGKFAFAPGVSAQSFAAKEWKLISEGRDWENTDLRCDNDIVPEAPFKALCDLIDADPGRRCTHVSVPDQRHCAYYSAHFATECIDWFRGL